MPCCRQFCFCFNQRFFGANVTTLLFQNPRKPTWWNQNWSHHVCPAGRPTSHPVSITISYNVSGSVSDFCYKFLFYCCYLCFQNLDMNWFLQTAAAAAGMLPSGRYFVSSHWSTWKVLSKRTKSHHNNTPGSTPGHWVSCFLFIVCYF